MIVQLLYFKAVAFLYPKNYPLLYIYALVWGQKSLYLCTKKRFMVS